MPITVTNALSPTRTWRLTQALGEARMTSSLRVAEFSVKTRKDTGVNTAHMNSTAPTMITIPLTRTGLASHLHDDQPAGRPLQGFAQLGPTWPQRPASLWYTRPCPCLYVGGRHAPACTAPPHQPHVNGYRSGRPRTPACPRRAPHPLNARNAPISTRRSGLLIPESDLRHEMHIPPVRNRTPVLLGMLSAHEDHGVPDRPDRAGLGAADR